MITLNRWNTYLTLKQLITKLDRDLKVAEFVYKDGNLFVANGTEVPFGYDRTYVSYSPTGEPIGVPDVIVNLGSDLIGAKEVYIFESDVEEFLNELKAYLDETDPFWLARKDETPEAADDRRNLLKRLNDVWLAYGLQWRRDHKHATRTERQENDVLNAELRHIHDRLKKPLPIENEYREYVENLMSGIS